jgi:hypothetical protein
VLRLILTWPISLARSLTHCAQVLNSGDKVKDDVDDIRDAVRKGNEGAVKAYEKRLDEDVRDFIRVRVVYLKIRCNPHTFTRFLWYMCVDISLFVCIFCLTVPGRKGRRQDRRSDGPQEDSRGSRSTRQGTPLDRSL